MTFKDFFSSKKHLNNIKSPTLYTISKLLALKFKLDLSIQ